ncbi:hypothetical protein OSJ77_10560 [Phyllobacterium sp. 0TCS1.6C]|uniref:hypothetical protein n=1 Tax=unclassified Phyllobacterium TaxID=2638441 RepID=UPI0022654929|nr:MULTISPECIES: hypothetical protein [unclassified Phyllobacterium]MCX8280633.1 hypothetical protein [Phyllobacterium sp. 0TCS1.6C]MCX8292790.1 hypothetical protein [Phyllobacterium sp. 0TCS1.6A]
MAGKTTGWGRAVGLAVGALAAMIAASNGARAERIAICHGYGCHFRTSLTLSNADRARIAAIMAGGKTSPAAERNATRRAVQYFERRGTAAIGIRDRPKMEFGKGREKGQMDCVDESTNTGRFLKYLKQNGMLRFHVPANRASRGNFIDGRYPHFTAVMVDRAGSSWAVDSWYEPGGGLPDIMPLSRWKQRGYGGQR